MAYLATHQKIFHGKYNANFKMLAGSGLGMLIIGICVGSSGFNIITKKLFSDLAPFIQLLLAWVGLIFGSQFKTSLIKKIPPLYYIGIFFQAIATYFIIATIFYLIQSYFHLSYGHLFPFIMASIGCVSGPTILSLAIRDQKTVSPLIRYLQVATSIDAIVGIVAFTLLFPSTVIEKLDVSPAINFGIMASLAILLGILFKLYVRLTTNRNEQFLLLIGMLTFTGGIAYSLHYSAIFINMIIGFILCNDNKAGPWIDRQLAVGERPFYLLLLLVLGSQFEYQYFTTMSFTMISIFVFTRILGKVISISFVDKVLFPDQVISYKSGLAFTFQGGVSIAMAISFLTIYPTNVSGNQTILQSILCILIISIIVNALISPYLTNKSISGNNKSNQEETS